MRLDEYVALDATGLADALGRGAVTAAEVEALATAAHLAVHGRLNAVVEWYEAPDPPPSGPWSGVPYLRKDYGATEAGRRTERGSRLSAGWTASATSPLVERWRQLGLHSRGRSAVPEFILHATTESSVHGITRNPWNPETSAGGSSGGAAAAVAAGVVPLAHASDCAGSIRIPASVCGLIGLKPSRGRVPWTDGTTGGGWGGIAEELMVARSVRDVRRVLHASDHSPEMPVTDGPLRVRVVVGHWAGAGTDPPVVEAVDAVGRQLDGAGHRVTAGDWPVPYDELTSLMDPLFGGGALDDADAVAAATGRTIDAVTVEPLTLAYLTAVRELGADARAQASARASSLTARLDQWLADVDVVVCSTLGRASLPLGRLATGPLAQWATGNDEFTPHSFVANVTGWPALSLPWGRGPDGVPVGVQLLGRRDADEQLLTLADELSDAAPALGRPAVWAGD